MGIGKTRACVIFSPDVPGVPMSAPGIGATPPGPAVLGITGGGVAPGVTGCAPSGGWEIDGGCDAAGMAERGKAADGAAAPGSPAPAPGAWAAAGAGSSQENSKPAMTIDGQADRAGIDPISDKTPPPRTGAFMGLPLNRSHPCARGMAGREGPATRGRAGRRGGPSPIRFILSLTDRQTGSPRRVIGHWSLVTGGGCGGFATFVPGHRSFGGGCGGSPAPPMTNDQ